ncbi:MAG: alginate export family protein [Novosphingobium sp.]
MKFRNRAAALGALPLSLVLAHSALAAAPAPQFGDPVKVNADLTFDPIIDGRLRYEHVDQPTKDADAVTMRLRAGFEFKHLPSHLSLLAEAEGTLAIVDNYSAFPFASASHQVRPAYSVVADPSNVELNRLQLQYKTKALTVTVGRQRINLDDQRFVGSVGWRQNEQTFDAVRGEAKIGPVSLDGTYSISQRTVFGVDSGPRAGYGGDFIFLGAGLKAGPVQVKAFSYLLDYNEAFFFANSSQTYGARAVAALPLSKTVKLNLAASYARQSRYGTNPTAYTADYLAGEAGIAAMGFSVTGGYESLGSNGAKSFQTPMATLHKFNGWADIFLTTPAGGLQDIYGGVAYKFDGIKALPGLNAAITYHQFDSDVGNVNYGHEWDAAVGFKVRKVGILAKYADYKALGFGTSTKKFWIQAEFAF